MKTRSQALRPEVLDGGPLHYAPVNELGVVYLFSHLAREKRLRVEHIQSGFPDCIAFQEVGGREKRIRIEFEYKAKNFKAHGHSPRGCDWIVCWENNWPEAPERLKIVELRREFGMGFNVWIQPVSDPHKDEIRRSRSVEWSLASGAANGDLVLVYYSNPDKCISDVFRISGPVKKHKRAGWSQKPDYMGQIRLVCRLKAPLFLEHLRRNHILKTSGFVRGNMRGRPRATKVWPDLHDLIIRKNPGLKGKLKKYAGENI